MNLLRGLFLARCFGCGRELKQGQAFCFACQRELLRPPPNPHALFRHEGAGAQLIGALREPAPHRMAAWCLRILQRRGLLARWGREGVQVVVHAPQNPKARPSGLAAVSERVAREIGAKWISSAFRKTSRRSQHGRSRSSRMDTPCFLELACAEALVRGQQVLVLDDVLTTGTTLDLCAYVLRRAGASKVRKFSLAYQVVNSLDREHEKAHEEGEKVHPLLFDLGVEVGKEVGRSDVEKSPGGHSQS